MIICVIHFSILRSYRISTPNTGVDVLNKKVVFMIISLCLRNDSDSKVFIAFIDLYKSNEILKIILNDYFCG